MKEMKDLLQLSSTFTLCVKYIFCLILFIVNISEAQIPSGFQWEQEFLVDFGDVTQTSGNWNNITLDNIPQTISNSSGTASLYNIEMTEGFFGSNGALSDASLSTGLGNLAENAATSDYIYSGISNGVEIIFSNLDPDKYYRLNVFGTRDASDTRTSEFTFSGATSSVGSLQTSGTGIGTSSHPDGNLSLYNTDAIQPDASGNITLAGKYTTGAFTYLGAARLVEYTAISPSSSFLIDFGTTEIVGADANGNTWNTSNYSNDPINNLLKSDGSSTSYQMNITSGWGLGTTSGLSDASLGNDLEDLAINDATSDYAIRTSGDITIDFTNLDTSKAYRFKIFGSRNIAADNSTEITISGATSTNGQFQSSSTATIGTTGYLNGNLDVYTTDYIFPDNGNTITFTAAIASGQININAIKLEEYSAETSEQDFLVDFGDLEETSSPDVNNNYWNNITLLQKNITLTSTENVSTSIGLDYNRGGFGLDGGMADATLSSGISNLAINSATTDYAYAAAGVSDYVEVEVNNLDVNKGYRFNIFATRSSINEDRITEYTIVGANTSVGQLQTSGTSIGTIGHVYGNLGLYSSSLVYPNNEGKITITATRAAGDFCYIGDIRIEEFSKNPISEDLLYIPQDEDFAFFNLPVSLINFDVSLQKQNALLEWSTASETNNDYFLIEHSTDGRNWKNINQINGAGNSNVQLDYSFIDEHLAIGNNYYRLTQVDFDGKSETFATKSIQFGVVNQNLISVNCYPNPIQQEGIINISFQQKSENDIHLALININGVLIQKERFSPSSSTIKWKLNSTQKGIYFLKIQVGTTQIIKKISIQ
ncbi:T9SS type A sorting domain-containing protein [Flammeovirga pectinis]|uniref:T9SS type A sorting domain-containing protein n=2 Tax=Flammeovirga pectinis TaxID=2494373 RepID=A0A3Q9FLX7_9BACT|nr:T9SS type A sorting domain-containing protein [Flammeovirga pectinis]